MKLRSIDWTCANPIKDGVPGRPHYTLYVTGASGNAECIEMLDREDLVLLRDIIDEIIRVDESLQKGGR